MVKERKTHSIPDDTMINTLKQLCADKKNTVFVVSGKERHSLTKTLVHVPNLGLAAEHGISRNKSPRMSAELTKERTVLSKLGAGRGKARCNSDKMDVMMWQTGQVRPTQHLVVAR